MLQALQDKPFIFVTGKGGVGKSTICASIALSLAKKNKRILLVEIDTFSAIAGLFELTLPPSTITPTPYPGLDVVNLVAQDALVEAIKQFVPSERVARGVIQNRIARVFFSAAPSVNEFSLLAQISRYITDKNSPYDHVIIDLPASGHAVTFLHVPETLHGMIRVGRLAKVSQEIAQQIQDPKTTALVAVCLPEEMPVNETIELSQAIQTSLGRPLTLTVLNMVHPEPFDEEDHALFDTLAANVDMPALENTSNASALEKIVQGNMLAKQWFDRDMHYVGTLRQKLGEAIEIIEAPMLYEALGRTVVEKLARHFNDEPILSTAHQSAAAS